MRQSQPIASATSLGGRFALTSGHRPRPPASRPTVSRCGHPCRPRSPVPLFQARNGNPETGLLPPRVNILNDADTIALSFADYYRTTILSEETDPNKLHDQKATLDGYQIYAWSEVEELVELFLSGADRDKLDPVLDACVAVYNTDLDEDGQVDFKGKAKAFVRTYQFLASILPYTNAEWEKLSIFLNFLIPKLPEPKAACSSRPSPAKEFQ
jgi:hypothetical protein